MDATILKIFSSLDKTISVLVRRIMPVLTRSRKMPFEWPLGLAVSSKVSASFEATNLTLERRTRAGAKGRNEERRKRAREEGIMRAEQHRCSLCCSALIIVPLTGTVSNLLMEILKRLSKIQL
jgi:hypothetical protein